MLKLEYGALDKENEDSEKLDVERNMPEELEDDTETGALDDETDA